MVSAKFPGVFGTWKVLQDGTRRRYWYHRETKIRLRGEPGSHEFATDYAKAIAFIRSRNNNENFIQLVREYTLSIEFEQTLAPSTQREYKRMLTSAEREFGTMPIAVLADRRVRKDFLDWRAKIARSSGLREADNRLSAVSAMLTWAVGSGRILQNHVAGFPRLYHANRADKIWLPEQIEAFMKVAPLEIQRALIIALHTGQRQGDILKMSWGAYDGTTITLRQGKARRKGVDAPPITIPCTATLRRMLDDMRRTSPLILTTKTGVSFKKRYFAHQWETAAKAAEIADLHFHDLRGTAVTMLSEAGCTPQQVATITGHSLKGVTAILDRYLARTRALADQAIINWENSPRTEFANRLQTGAPAPTLKKGKSDVKQ